jgi:hypothetical protein
MKVAIVADCHIGNHKRWGGQVRAGLNERCLVTLGVLERAYARARGLGCERFVVLGDMFDTTAPSPQLVAAVQRIFTTELKTIIIAGNHDRVSMSQGDHALGPLWPVSGVQVVETPQVVRLDGDLLLVPYQPGPVLDWLPQVVEELAGKSQAANKLLGLHMGIEAEGTPFYLKGSPSAIHRDILAQLMAEHGIQVTLAGDWHNRYLEHVNGGKGTVMQVGTLSPTGFDNPGLEGYGTLAVWEPHASNPKRRVTWEEIPGPRFVVSKEGEAMRSLGKKEQGWNIYLKRVVDNPSDVQSETAALHGMAKEGLFAGVEVALDQSNANARLRTAAHEARRASTVEEAVTRYVKNMPLKEGVGRDRVRDRVVDLLKE